MRGGKGPGPGGDGGWCTELPCGRAGFFSCEWRVMSCCQNAPTPPPNTPCVTRVLSPAAATVVAASAYTLPLPTHSLPIHSPLPPAPAPTQPLLLFPLLVVVLDGDELLGRLEADTARPLAALHADLARAHPEASPLVYVVGLEAAMKRRERANKVKGGSRREGWSWS